MNNFKQLKRHARFTIDHSQRQMKIYTYAILKDYFDKEFAVDETVSNVDGLYHFLVQRNPAAKDILAACRFAVNDQFVTNDFTLNQQDQVHIIPPSSGG